MSFGDSRRSITAIAPSNIATIKYWGKRDEDLILPLNDSISVTLSVDLVRAKTTVSASPHFKDNRIWLNGLEENFDGNPRLVSCLEEIKKRARAKGDGKSDGIYDWKVHICSENNFPTAAGLASSAAGYACLVFALGQLYNIEGDLTVLARRGSGSACRSLHGGFVRWNMGSRPDGSDSIATQIAPSTAWPELRMLILTVKDKKKDVSSKSGMKRSVLTSELLTHRVKNCVPQRAEDMQKAILAKDFPRFAEITMRDSNQFHAIALDTFPPAVYMTDVSHNIASLIHSFNAACGETRVAYTYDAGANPCLFLLEQHVPLAVSLLEYYFPKASENFRGSPVDKVSLPEDLIREIPIEPYESGLVKGMIYTPVGDGPRLLTDNESLLDDNGLPIN